MTPVCHPSMLYICQTLFFSISNLHARSWIQARAHEWVGGGVMPNFPYLGEIQTKNVSLTGIYRSPYLHPDML